MSNRNKEKIKTCDVFIPLLPIQPPHVNFSNKEESFKALRISAEWYKAYAYYLESLIGCESFQDCVYKSKHVDWNNVVNNKFIINGGDVEY